MNYKSLSISALASLLALPVTALAFNAGNVPATQANFSVSALIDTVLGFAWPFIMLAVIILYIVVAFEFFGAAGEATKVAQARQHLIWAVVGTGILMLAFTIPFVVRTALGV